MLALSADTIICALRDGRAEARADLAFHKIS